MAGLVAIFTMPLVSYSAAWADDKIPSPSECTVAYVFRNDSSFYSRSEYSLTAECERALFAQVLNKKDPSIEERYVVLKIQADREKTRLVAAEGLKQLCEVDRYPRSCSAIALLIQSQLIDGTDAEFIRYVMPAVAADIPQALNSLGLHEFSRYRKTNDRAALCAALRSWRRGGELGDADIAERYRAAHEKFGALCIES